MQFRVAAVLFVVALTLAPTEAVVGRLARRSPRNRTPGNADAAPANGATAGAGAV